MICLSPKLESPLPCRCSRQVPVVWDFGSGWQVICCVCQLRGKGGSSRVEAVRQWNSAGWRKEARRST